jgi:hypothetical protein
MSASRRVGVLSRTYVPSTPVLVTGCCYTDHLTVKIGVRGPRDDDHTRDAHDHHKRNLGETERYPDNRRHGEEYGITQSDPIHPTCSVLSRVLFVVLYGVAYPWQNYGHSERHDHLINPDVYTGERELQLCIEDHAKECEPRGGPDHHESPRRYTRLVQYDPDQGDPYKHSSCDQSDVADGWRRLLLTEPNQGLFDIQGLFDRRGS